MRKWLKRIANFGNSFSLICILIFSISTMIIVNPVEAQGRIIDFTYQKNTTYIGQPNEISANVAALTAFTPPLSYQWYTEFIPQNVVDDPRFPAILLFPSTQIVRVEESGATSSTFTFLKYTPGTYNVILHLTDSLGHDLGASTKFMVVLPLPANLPPSIQIISPENKNYTVNDIILNYTTSASTQWSGYSIDGNANVTLAANSTLPQLSNGLHNVTIYANDTFGNIGKSETINFTVTIPEPSKIESESLSPTFTITSVAAAAVAVFLTIAIVVLFFRRQRKAAKHS
jgi:hypothetical protein